MSSLEPSVLPDLVLEHVHAIRIGVDPVTGAVPSTLRLALQLLSEISVEPAQVRLVVTGDIVRSVQSRLLEEPGGESFDLTRGSGLVAGKTMPRADGTIDVVVPWWALNVELDNEHRLAAEPLLVHTVAHEAHHVAMRQNEQSYTMPAKLSWRDRNFRAAADSVIDEYRAELGVAVILDEDNAAWEPLEVLRSLSAGLGRAVAKYQVDQDVPRLAVETFGATLHAWRAMAYIAAVDVHEAGRSTVTEATRADALWQRMAEPWWEDFRATLAKVPTGTATMTSADVARVVETVADVLGSWFAGLGFVWSDELFQIEQWYLSDEDFLRALGRDESAPAAHSQDDVEDL